jgi:hypothetical protein
MTLVIMQFLRPPGTCSSLALSRLLSVSIQFVSVWSTKAADSRMVVRRITMRQRN